MKSKKWLIPVAIVAAVAVIVTAVIAVFWPFTPPYDIEQHFSRTESGVSISSPDKTTLLTLGVDDGQLTYTVERDGVTFMRASPLGITVDDTNYGAVDSLDEIGTPDGALRHDTRAINGRKAVADDPCVQALIPIGDSGLFTLEARVFNNGIAFRYLVSGEGKRSLKSEQTGFILPADSNVWAGEAHIYYESINKFWDPEKVSMELLGAPATIILDEGGYAAILEGNLSGNYPGIKLEWLSKYCYGATFDNNNKAYSLQDDITTPWRIITVADDLNELVNNTIVYQVCDEADSTLFADDWVEPGRAAWSWITGRTTDRVTPKLMREYTDYAAKLGFEYNIIDEGWINWGDYEDTLQELAAQGEDYDVGQILWTGVTAGESFRGGIDSAEDAYAYLDFLKEMQMAGGKIDFFTTEKHVEMGVDIYTDILQYAAEQQLVINFHGCNKPTGLDATYPNELNREAILGLESTQINSLKTQAQMFTTQPFVRNLAGHADYTPAVDTAFHMAQLVLTDAPMQAIGSDPEDILASPALEMIKSVPTVWQETVVLPQSAIGKTAVIARKGGGGSWYVGGINNTGKDDEITLDLSLFLGDGSYRCELWTDGVKSLEKTEKTVTKDDTLTIPFDQLEGFIVRFDRVTLSQYGGEIDPDSPVTLTVTDPDTTVRYTLDGSVPTASSPVWADGEGLTFAESTTLTVGLFGGADDGLVESYRFNKID